MGIDRDHVVSTALRLLDEDGLDKLSLRRIAGELGVQAPALYWHFDNKRALLDHITDLMIAPALAELGAPADPADWAQWLTRTAHVLRRTLLAHRDGPQVALGANLGRAVSLGLIIDRATAVLHAGGFDLVESSRAAGAFIAFVIGRTAEEDALTRIDPSTWETAATYYPTLARAMAARQAAPDTDDEEFGYTASIMVEGLRALHRQRDPARIP